MKYTNPQLSLPHINNIDNNYKLSTTCIYNNNSPQQHILMDLSQYNLHHLVILLQATIPSTITFYTTTTNTQIIAWTIQHITSSLPSIMELIESRHTKPTIVLLQETKFPKHKSTTYIDNRFLDYKIIHNHTKHDTHPKKPTSFHP